MSLQTFAGLRIDTSCLNGLPSTAGLDYVRLDDRSMTILRRIQDRMELLESKAPEEGKVLRFEVVTDDEKVKWWFVRSFAWKDMRILVVGDTLTFRSDMGLGDRDKGVVEGRRDLSPSLTPLAGYIGSLVDAVLRDPEGYRTYVEEHYPYELRTGRILRRDYRKITGENPWEECRPFAQDVEGFLRKKMDDEPRSERLITKGMTMRYYLDAWCTAFCGTLPTASRIPEKRLLMKRYRELENTGINLDSEEDFIDFLKTLPGSHFEDIDYARLSLFICSWLGEPEPRYRLDLMTHGENHEEGLRAAMALDAAGIPFLFCDAKDILEDYLGAGLLTFEPLASFSGAAGLAEVRQRLDPETYGRLVAAIDWEPVIKQP